MLKCPDLTDIELICKYDEMKRFEQIGLLPMMAKRANYSPLILDKMLSKVKSEEELQVKVMGVIKFGWLPAIYLLIEGNKENISKLIDIIQNWPVVERELFYEYVKGESFAQEYLECLNLDGRKDK